jgi:hypothetical protein
VEPDARLVEDVHVEDDRRLSGARDPGEDRDFAFRNAQRDVFEVVFAPAADLDELGRAILPQAS